MPNHHNILGRPHAKIKNEIARTEGNFTLDSLLDNSQFFFGPGKGSDGAKKS